MTNTRDIIIKLKEVRDEKKYSYNDILDMMEKNGDYLSKSTISRVFADGSEDLSFRYEETIRPIANALLDVSTIEETDNKEVSLLKSMIQFNAKTTNNNKKELEQLKIDHANEILNLHRKIDRERNEWNSNLDFMKSQIMLKDQTIKSLLDAVKLKDEQYQALLDTIMSCPCRKAKENG